MPRDYQSPAAKQRANEISGEVVRASLTVHTRLGPGLLESVYQECMLRELKKRDIRCASQVQIPIFYDGSLLTSKLRLDLLVEDLLIAELKSVDYLGPLHTAQLLTYLRLSARWLGLLINFNTTHLKDGLKRVAN